MGSFARHEPRRPPEGAPTRLTGAGGDDFPTAGRGHASTGSVTDACLLERARAGDADAFGGLVDLHRAAVFRAALAALGSAADAEDVAQEAFVSAYRALPGFRGEASFRTWVVAIAWRLAVRQRRSLRFRVRRWQAGEETLAVLPAPAADPEQQAGHAEQVAHVTRLIRALPAELRDPLLLVASGEHAYDEVAVMLGTPVGTVKWRVSEARRRLRERLAPKGDAHE